MAAPCCRLLLLLLLPPAAASLLPLMWWVPQMALVLLPLEVPLAVLWAPLLRQPVLLLLLWVSLLLPLAWLSFAGGSSCLSSSSPAGAPARGGPELAEVSCAARLAPGGQHPHLFSALLGVASRGLTSMPSLQQQQQWGPQMTATHPPAQQPLTALAAIPHSAS
jgi:hypothetical protein